MLKVFLLVSALLMSLTHWAFAQQTTKVVLASSNAVSEVDTQSTRRHGQVLADILIDRNITGVAVTYISDEYGKTLETAFAEAFEAHGGRVAISISHQDGEENHFAAIGALAAAGVEHLVVLGRLNQGGLGIVQTALDTGAFEKFVLGEGMIGEQLIQTVGNQLDGALGAQRDAAVADAAVADDAAAMPQDETVSPEDKILPGELARAVDLVKNSDQVDVSNNQILPILPVGNATGAFRELEIKNGKFETVKIR